MCHPKDWLGHLHPLPGSWSPVLLSGWNQHSKYLYHPSCCCRHDQRPKSPHMQSTPSKRARSVFLETLLPSVAWSARDTTWGGAAGALAVANGTRGARRHPATLSSPWWAVPGSRGSSPPLQRLSKKLHSRDWLVPQCTACICSPSLL